MEILILGYSNLSQRKIIPTLLESFKDIKISICSKSKRKIKNIEWYNSYKDALIKSKAEIVYISLHNSKHYFWAKKFLNYNYHVIVDKPATLKYQNTKDLVSLAKSKKKLFAESTVFDYHEQIKFIINKTKNIKEKNIKISSRFTIPLLPKKNFRRKSSLGGGCINDMGSYAASIYRIFCKYKIKKKNFILIKKKFKKNLNENFMIKVKNKNFEYEGFFSHNDKYENKLKLYTLQKNYEINRVFSPPSNQNLIIKINNVKKRYERKIELKKDNVFKNFFKECLESIKKKDFNNFYENSLKDSLFREHLI